MSVTRVGLFCNFPFLPGKSGSTGNTLWQHNMNWKLLHSWNQWSDLSFEVPERAQRRRQRDGENSKTTMPPFCLVPRRRSFSPAPTMLRQTLNCLRPSRNKKIIFLLFCKDFQGQLCPNNGLSSTQSSTGRQQPAVAKQHKRSKKSHSYIFPFVYNLCLIGKERWELQ